MSKLHINRKKLYQVLINVPLNGAFLMGLVCIIYLIIPLNIKRDILSKSVKSAIIFLCALIIISIIISIFQNISEYLKLINYSIFIGMLCYISVHVIFSLLNLMSNMIINISIIPINIVFDIQLIILYLLSFFELISNSVKNIKKCISLIIIGFYIALILLPFAISINQFGGYLIIILYFVIISVYKKRVKIFLKIIKESIANRLISFLFYSMLIILTGTITVFYFKNLQSLFDDWLPILAISISLLIVSINYYPKLKRIQGFETLLLCYFLVWTIIPLLFFVLYLQRYFWGYYSVFKILLGIILCLDAIAVLTFGSDMNNLMVKVQKKNSLIKKYGIKILVSKIKLLLGNITIFATLANAIFFNKSMSAKCIEKVSEFLYQVGEKSNYYFGAFNMDSKFKMIVFQFSVIVSIILLSVFAFELEKFLYKKIIFINHIYKWK